LAMGANANAADEAGATPLHRLADVFPPPNTPRSTAAHALLRAPLAHGADPHAKDAQGRAARDLVFHPGSKGAFKAALSKAADEL